MEAVRNNPDLWTIILDFKYQLEHTERSRPYRIIIQLAGFSWYNPSFWYNAKLFNDYNALRALFSARRLLRVAKGFCDFQTFLEGLKAYEEARQLRICEM